MDSCQLVKYLAVFATLFTAGMPAVTPTHGDGLVPHEPQSEQLNQIPQTTESPTTSSLVRATDDFEGTVKLQHGKSQTISKNENDVGQDSFESGSGQITHKKGGRQHERQADERHHGHKRPHGHHGHSHGFHARKSCATKSAFVYKAEAEDIFGDNVSIYPSIHIGKLAIDQYFYETFCDTEACSCSGIDNTRYRSSCQTDYSFTYARVIKHGEIGWSQILVRSGCSCVIHEQRMPKWIGNIMDAI